MSLRRPAYVDRQPPEASPRAASRLDHVLHIGAMRSARLGRSPVATPNTAAPYSYTTMPSSQHTITVNDVEISTDLANWSGLTLDEVVRLQLAPVNKTEYYWSTFTDKYVFLLKDLRKTDGIAYYVVATPKESVEGWRTLSGIRPIVINNVMISTDPAKWSGLKLKEMTALQLNPVNMSEYGKDGAIYKSAFTDIVNFFVKDLKRSDGVSYYVLARPVTDRNTYVYR